MSYRAFSIEELAKANCDFNGFKQCLEPWEYFLSKLDDSTTNRLVNLILFGDENAGPSYRYDSTDGNYWLIEDPTNDQ